MSERRHRIPGREVPHVASYAMTQLQHVLHVRNPEDLYGAVQVFKFLWRVHRHAIGQPGYPTDEDGEITWTVIEQNLEFMEPYLEAVESG